MSSLFVSHHHAAKNIVRRFSAAAAAVACTKKGSTASPVRVGGGSVAKQQNTMAARRTPQQRCVPPMAAASISSFASNHDVVDNMTFATTLNDTHRYNHFLDQQEQQQQSHFVQPPPITMPGIAQQWNSVVPTSHRTRTGTDSVSSVADLVSDLMKNKIENWDHQNYFPSVGVLEDTSNDDGATTVQYDCMNRNARRGKRANHMKRPVSRQLRRKKVRSIGNHRR